VCWSIFQGRNRRCITVDLHKEEGRQLIRALSEKVDVLVENFRPGVMEKWGLGPKVLTAVIVRIAFVIINVLNMNVITIVFEKRGPRC
jgi:crotonobetainyl-CoA:carnitine CoA-transferase CaiB-like acyl-CoA transferase